MTGIPALDYVRYAHVSSSYSCTLCSITSRCKFQRIMGKRRKEELELQNSDDKKSKRTKGLLSQDHLKNDNVAIELSLQRASNKPMKIIFDDDGQPAQSKPNINTAKPVKDKIMNKGNSKNKKHNKKNQIIFEDSSDQPSQVASNNVQSSETSNQNEDEVKDEDIDKFCDEIEEEDNVQYENWVKLIEQKLTSNKKKS